MNHGFILADKPKDWTSHDVVAYIRGIIREYTKKVEQLTENDKAKVGHAGTLDPFATGLLIVGIGREATKKLDEFKILPKTYIATLKLGATSDTYDKTGKIVESGKWEVGRVAEKKVQQILKSFVGKQKQIPPMFSAKKINGKKLYELARKGIEIERQPNEIEIYNIELISYNPITYHLSLIINCSSGTYIRTLAHDIGHKLGCGAYCEELERTKIGKYSVKDACDPKSITAKKYKDLLIQG